MKANLKEVLDMIKSCNEPTVLTIALLENLMMIYTRGWQSLGWTEKERDVVVNAILDQYNKLKQS